MPTDLSDPVLLTPSLSQGPKYTSANVALLNVDTAVCTCVSDFLLL